MVDFYRFTRLNAQPKCLHAVTMKSEDAPFSLSLALHTGEFQDRIVENRKLIEKSFAMEGLLYFVVANQTHSDHIVIVTEAETKGWEEQESAVADCDALITDQRGVMLGVLTADCVPILLFDPVCEVVAAVHAGWKGSKAKIVAKTVKKMMEVFGADPTHIIAAIAPAIGECCYEVGEEVAEHFFSVPESVSRKGQKYMLNLPYINKYQLIDAGLKEEHIELSGICTACNTERFFSYRKERECSGRFMSFIGILPEAK